MGAHIGTMPYKVFEQLFHHPLTDKGLAAIPERLGKGARRPGRHSAGAVGPKAGR